MCGPLSDLCIGISQATPRVTYSSRLLNSISRGLKGERPSSWPARRPASSPGRLRPTRSQTTILPTHGCSSARSCSRADFYARAIASKRFDGKAQASLRRARFNEREHYKSMAGVLSDAGQTPAVAAASRAKFLLKTSSMPGNGGVASRCPSQATISMHTSHWMARS